MAAADYSRIRRVLPTIAKLRVAASSTLVAPTPLNKMGEREQGW
jgi:hypothetical protein